MAGGQTKRKGQEGRSGGGGGHRQRLGRALLPPGLRGGVGGGRGGGALEVADGQRGAVLHGNEFFGVLLLGVDFLLGLLLLHQRERLLAPQAHGLCGATTDLAQQSVAAGIPEVTP